MTFLIAVLIVLGAPHGPRRIVVAPDGEVTTVAAALRLARLKAHVRTVLAADGVLDAIGPGHVHGNVDEAVRAQVAGASNELASPDTGISNSLDDPTRRQTRK